MMSDMQAALEAARSTHSTTAPSPNPTPTSGSRYDAPITAAHQDGLPIIDISSFLDPTSAPSSRQTTAFAINAACINYGFFYLTGHGIPTSTLDEVISLAHEFFSLPLDEKNEIKRFDANGPEGGDGARGYQGLGENVTGGLQDMQEAIDWYASWPSSKRSSGTGGPDSVPSLQGENLWPANPPDLKAVYTAYISRVQAVGEALVHAMGVALDLGPPSLHPSMTDEDEETFLRHCSPSFWVMRMIGYPPLPSPLPSSSTDSSAIDQFSCGAHTDYGCITLLLSDPTPSALQVRLKDGTWLNADPVPGAFVVNIGDMIERWTNGLWKSTMHRVIHRGGARRVSVPFFYEPAFEAMVRPLGKCVQRTGGRRVHEGSTYGEHLLTKVFSNFYYSKRTDW